MAPGYFSAMGAIGVALGLIAAALLGIAVLASYIPARPATRVDPLTALRAE